MSNTQAIATVTATLQMMIQNEISQDFPGAIVKSGRPTASSTGTAPEVNIFLYQITPNTAFRNIDLPSRDSQGRLRQRLQTGLDLYYLLSFYGEEQQNVPQRLLGHTVRIMHTNPILTPEMILNAINNPVFDYLKDSDLADQVDLIKFSPMSYSLQELSQLWSVFLQTTYVLSVPYHASVVLIDGQQIPQPTAPVKKDGVHIQVNAFGNGPLTTASDLHLTNVMLTGGQLSADVIIGKANPETQIDYYALYWGKNAIEQLPLTALAVIPKNGKDITYSLSSVTVPAGAKYLMVFTGNKQGEMKRGLSASFIETGLPTQTASSVAFTDQDPHGTLLGGPVTIYKAENESSFTTYVLYWGSSQTTKLAEQNKIVALVKTGKDLIYTFPMGTPLPVGATHLLVYTRSDIGEMATCVSTRIQDVMTTPPIHAAKGVIFDGVIVNTGSGQAWITSGSVNITRASDERDISSYLMYWGISPTEKYIKEPDPIAELEKNGSDLIYNFTEKKLIPDGVNYLLVFTGNYYGEMAIPVSCVLKIN